ncbi:MAG: hypothetical protein KF756_09635 [Acidobacteria bacterium]|nr:hypothetical protein [Acidobacteriota bacterium]
MKRIQKVTTNLILTIFCISTLLSSAPVMAKAPDRNPNIRFTTLEPGAFREINQQLDINIVFVGFQRGNGYQQVDETRMRQFLASHYRTFNWQTGFVGNSFDYRYNVRFAPRRFEDSFFSYLDSQRHTECVVTGMQEYYNAEPSHSVNVTENSCIDPNDTERWLGDHARDIGIDPTKYTIFFINWWGRPDFHFHTYSIWDHSDPDPDTGFSRTDYYLYETQAWGGTTPDDEQNGLGSLRRIWFYDLSAGPDYWTNSYDLNTADINGDGYADYRIPPIWEYGNMSAYRPFDDLSGDLSQIVRYLAIDAQFTSSPVFNPALSERLPNSIQTDITYFNGDGGARGQDLMKPSRGLLEMKKLRPFNPFSIAERDVPYTAEHDAAYQCALPYWFGTPTNCYPGRSNASWDMNIFHSDHLNDYVHGNVDYEIMNFAYTLPDVESPGQLLGVAFSMGSYPGFSYDWSIPSNRETIGMSNTMIHEVGHQLGLPHPHDVYDYEDNGIYYQRYFPFMASADESDSVMGYMILSNNYSQFDRDNMDRWMTAININHANALLPDILTHDLQPNDKAHLIAAESAATLALVSYRTMHYRAAAGFAKSAYDNVIFVADRLGTSSTTLENRRSSGQLLEQRPVIEDDTFNPLRRMSDPFGFLRNNPNVVNPMVNADHPKFAKRSSKQ